MGRRPRTWRPRKAWRAVKKVVEHGMFKQGVVVVPCEAIFTPPKRWVVERPDVVGEHRPIVADHIVVVDDQRPPCEAEGRWLIGIDLATDRQGNGNDIIFQATAGKNGIDTYRLAPFVEIAFFLAVVNSLLLSTASGFEVGGRPPEGILDGSQGEGAMKFDVTLKMGAPGLGANFFSRDNVAEVGVFRQGSQMVEAVLETDDLSMGAFGDRRKPGEAPAADARWGHFGKKRTCSKKTVSAFVRP